ncbi:MAG: pyrophosphate--fructose-6-phosphate 1-phosphotransferase, partial [Actinobacteria bacterium]|nr:pyrophosphate--fructose-6-phosphate 1-phosphotransferase [Actinomycetota bacterium]
KECAAVAVAAALDGVSGLVGHDEERGGELRAVEFPRVKGGKPFDTSVDWFTSMLRDVGQV